MADSKQMLVLFGDELAYRPTFNRPARVSKRWTKVQKFRRVVAENGEHAPYLVAYEVEVFCLVDLPADRPRITWDL